ncbi:MAG TPA: hypothetical protein VFQ85_07700 [Mycobacteriales bacterium]|nr:hypothetical protein [Mycobacteriales bacterium]
MRGLLALALLGAAVARADAFTGPQAGLGDVRLAEHPAATATVLPRDAIGTLLRGAMNKTDKYALTVWWQQYMTGVDPYLTANERARTNQTIDSEEVRRYTSVAYALAASLATGAYDSAVTGVEKAVATERVVELVTYVATTHRANLMSSKGWGGSVQAALWAAQITTAGWLIGPALPPPTQVLLGRLMAYEADIVAKRELHYLRDTAHHVLTPGNSGAEELAWDGVALYTAVELLPHHANRGRWAQAAYERFVGAFSRPQDIHSTYVVNGRTVADWLDGSNAEPDGFVVNHYRINPDYTTDIALWAAPVSGLVGTAVPESVLAGADVTYKALTTVRFDPRVYNAPGGTVYRPGSSAVYYPRGADWGEHREAVYAGLDVQTAVLSTDPRVRDVAAKWARVHLDVVRGMQARFTTGQIYGPQSEDHYRSREEHAAMVLANAYLTWWLRANQRVSVDTRPASAKAPLL